MFHNSSFEITAAEGQITAAPVITRFTAQPTVFFKGLFKVSKTAA